MRVRAEWGGAPMKPYFAEPSKALVAIPFWGVLYNRPVNLSLCQSLRRAFLTDENRPTVPTLAFEGCNTSWFFETEAEREAEMRKLIEEQA